MKKKKKIMKITIIYNLMNLNLIFQMKNKKMNKK